MATMIVTTVIDYKYLMNKSKHELASWILDTIRRQEDDGKINKTNNNIIGTALYALMAYRLYVKDTCPDKRLKEIALRDIDTAIKYFERMIV